MLFSLYILARADKLAERTEQWIFEALLEN